MGFKRPKTHFWVGWALKKHALRRAAAGTAVLALLAGAIALTVVFLQRGEKAPPATAAVPTPSGFQAEAAWTEALALLDRARDNEFKGRRGGVLEDYRAALALLDEIRQRAPGFKSREIEAKIRFCELRLRKSP
ncbi:MAG TPA: hypothetical protein PLI51_03805 [bacterium]|nr:hypothetical protein [bacterium]HPQ65835.1 hypothetical protein [bacterium]